MHQTCVFRGNYSYRLEKLGNQTTASTFKCEMHLIFVFPASRASSVGLVTGKNCANGRYGRRKTARQATHSFAQIFPVTMQHQLTQQHALSVGCSGIYSPFFFFFKHEFSICQPHEKCNWVASLSEASQLGDLRTTFDEKN